jgi:hypothetical protein
VALNQEWQELMENRQSGAMAGVYYLSGQVEDSLLASAPRRWSNRCSSSSRRH